MTIARQLPETAYSIYSQRPSTPESPLLNREHEDTPYQCDAGPHNVKQYVVELTRDPLLSYAHELYSIHPLEQGSALQRW
jgi:hypothetical protein